MSVTLVRMTMPMPEVVRLRGLAKDEGALIPLSVRPLRLAQNLSKEKQKRFDSNREAQACLVRLSACEELRALRPVVKANLALAYVELEAHVTEVESSIATWASNPKTERRVTKEKLLEKLEFQLDTGEFTWKTAFRRGQIAGCVCEERGKVYRRIGINGELIMAHALVWLAVHGEFPRHEIDHLDGNGLNNRPANLVKSNRLTNNSNARKREDSAEHRAVHVQGNLWQIAVKYAKKTFVVSGFDTPDLAAKARNFLETLIPRGVSHGQDKLYPQQPTTTPS